MACIAWCGLCGMKGDSPFFNHDCQPATESGRLLKAAWEKDIREASKQILEDFRKNSIFSKLTEPTDGETK